MTFLFDVHVLRESCIFDADQEGFASGNDHVEQPQEALTELVDIASLVADEADKPREDAVLEVVENLVSDDEDGALNNMEEILEIDGPTEEPLVDLTCISGDEAEAL